MCAVTFADGRDSLPVNVKPAAPTTALSSARPIAFLVLFLASGVRMPSPLRSLCQNHRDVFSAHNPLRITVLLDHQGRQDSCQFLGAMAGTMPANKRIINGQLQSPRREPCKKHRVRAELGSYILCPTVTKVRQASDRSTVGHFL